MHGTDEDEVGFGEVFVADFLEGMVEDAELPGAGTEGGYGDEAEGRGHGGLGEHLEDAFEAPEGGREAGPDEEDVQVCAEGQKAGSSKGGRRGPIRDGRQDGQGGVRFTRKRKHDLFCPFPGSGACLFMVKHVVGS